MSENTVRKSPARRLHFSHRGRIAQTGIYFGKLCRMFIYQSDWKVLPMAALIAAVVSMVVRNTFFLTMEGTLKGAFALTCVSIWNGCFNSIQVICRERPILKREHRSGLHITSYVFSHMLYQALLCLAQTLLTLYICRLMKVRFPSEGMFTRWMMLDIGVTVFLITFASDMLALWISALVRNTTTAMTVMPFILIFQLVFSGGIFKMPSWTKDVSRLSISNCGLKCIAAQADYNNTPMSSVWTAIKRLDNPNKDLTLNINPGKLLSALQDEEIEPIRQLRQTPITDKLTVNAVLTELENAVNAIGAEHFELSGGMPLTEVLTSIRLYAVSEGYADRRIAGFDTVGELIDYVLSFPYLSEKLNKTYKVDTNMHEIFKLVDENRLKEIVTDSTKGINYSKAYIKSEKNILSYWENLALFVIGFALLAIITLEFIDKDKR